MNDKLFFRYRMTGMPKLDIATQQEIITIPFRSIEAIRDGNKMEIIMIEGPKREWMIKHDDTCVNEKNIAIKHYHPGHPIILMKWFTHYPVQR